MLAVDRPGHTWRYMYVLVISKRIACLDIEHMPTILIFLSTDWSIASTCCGHREIQQTHSQHMLLKPVLAVAFSTQG